MSGEILTLMIVGSLKDPIFWIVGTIFGWDTQRGFLKSILVLAVAGLVWGGIRAAIYFHLGADLGLVGFAIMISVCIGLMGSFGIIIRQIRIVYLRGK